MCTHGTMRQWCLIVFPAIILKQKPYQCFVSYHNMLNHPLLMLLHFWVTYFLIVFFFFMEKSFYIVWAQYCFRLTRPKTAYRLIKYMQTYYHLNISFAFKCCSCSTYIFTVLLLKYVLILSARFCFLTALGLARCHGDGLIVSGWCGVLYSAFPVWYTAPPWERCLLV